MCVRLTSLWNICVVFSLISKIFFSSCIRFDLKFVCHFKNGAVLTFIQKFNVNFTEFGDSKSGILVHFSYKLHCNQRNGSFLFGFGKIKIYNIIPRLKWAENILSQFYMHIFSSISLSNVCFQKNLILWEYDFQNQKYVQQQNQGVTTIWISYKNWSLLLLSLICSLTSTSAYCTRMICLTVMAASYREKL